MDITAYVHFSHCLPLSSYSNHEWPQLDYGASDRDSVTFMLQVTLRPPASGRLPPSLSLVGGSSQLPRLATGRAAITNGHSHRMFYRSLRPFPWPPRQRKSFTPEALYIMIVCSCHERDTKKIFISSTARAENYDTPAQQCEDSTTFMVTDNMILHYYHMLHYHYGVCKAATRGLSRQ